MSGQHHTRIATRGQTHRLAVWLALALGLVPACSHQLGELSQNQDALGSRQLPFTQTSQKTGVSPTQALATTVLPGGTPIIVRLRSELSSGESQPGDSFEATLDEPVMVEAAAVAPRGSRVVGRVASVGAADLAQHSGYLRLTLSSVEIGGRAFDVHTSSIF